MVADEWDDVVVVFEVEEVVVSTRDSQKRPIHVLENILNIKCNPSPNPILFRKHFCSSHGLHVAVTFAVHFEQLVQNLLRVSAPASRSRLVTQSRTSGQRSREMNLFRLFGEWYSLRVRGCPDSS